MKIVQLYFFLQFLVIKTLDPDSEPERIHLIQVFKNSIFLASLLGFQAFRHVEKSLFTSRKPFQLTPNADLNLGYKWNVVKNTGASWFGLNM